MHQINDIIKVFKINFNKKTLNNHSLKQLRNRKDGIKPEDIILYRLLYCQDHTTKSDVVSKLNDINKTYLSRQSYDHKDNNISYTFYENLFYELLKLFQPNKTKLTKPSIVAVDGVCNNDKDRRVMTNLGIFNVSSNIPINIGYYGANNRNNEVNKFKEYLFNNLSDIKSNNYIFVCDRLYFNYDLLDFFISNKLKFIVRIKGSGDNLDNSIPLKGNLKNNKIINKIRSKIRIVKSERSYPKSVNISKNKKRKEIVKLMVKNDCKIVTNLPNNKNYTDEILLNYYNNRWD